VQSLYTSVPTAVALVDVHAVQCNPSSTSLASAQASVISGGATLGDRQSP
jgi:hypothetical protein